MPPGDRQYWIRTEQGRVWGPYPLDALERLRGQLTEKAQASLDGKEFRSGMDFPELRLLLQNVPSADNPKTGRIVAMSVLKAVRNRLAPLVVGL